MAFFLRKSNHLNAIGESSPLIEQGSHARHGAENTEATIVFPKDFVIPGSSKASSAIELARTIIRRAERWCVTLGRENLLPGDHLLAYMNRLADLLWLLARQAEMLEASATRSVSQTPVRE